MDTKDITPGIDEDQALSIDDVPNDAIHWYISIAMTKQGEKQIMVEDNVIYVQFD